jgi:hypothetical protein
MSSARSSTCASNSAIFGGPDHQFEGDVKFVAPLMGSRKKHYQFISIDDCTRLRVLRDD